MKDNLIIFILLAAMLLVSYFYFHNVIVPQPEELRSLQTQIEEKNRQLLAAQILAEKREGVTSLIKNNLILSMGDSLAEKASVPFLRYLTGIMDQLDIRLIALTPLDILGADDPAKLKEMEFVQIPYELKILASYDELGKFLNLLEKSPRLIRVSNFTMNNDIDRSTLSEEIAGKPRQHPVDIQLNTIAVLKASYRSEPG